MTQRRWPERAVGGMGAKPAFASPDPARRPHPATTPILPQLQPQPQRPMTTPPPTHRLRRWPLHLLLAAALALGATPAAQAQSPSRTAAPQRNLEPVALQVPGGQRQTLYDASHALVIGASKYRNGWGQLPGVVDDVKAVSALLGRHGFEVSTLMDPTGVQLDQALRQFAGRYGVREGNRLLVYFAGHGHTQTRGNSKIGYIVPVDAPNPNKDLGGFITTAYPMQQMEVIAKTIQSRHALFIFDSCFSGTIFRTRSGVPDAITDRTARPVRQFITAGDEEQTVPDQSQFRRALERGLGADAEADRNGDRYITGTELGEYLYDEVTNYTRKAQTPRHGKIQDPELDRGDFVFLSPRQPSPPPDPHPKPPPVDQELERWTAALRANTEAAYTDFLRAYPGGAYASAARNALAAVKPPPPPPSTEAVGAVWKDCADCPELVGLPTGRFTMGSAEGEAGRDADEGPQHPVTISQRLAVGRYEVTRGQFGRFVQASGYKTEAEQNAGGVEGCFARNGSKYEYTEGRSWRDPGFEQTDEHPVVCVSWNDAQAYVKWLNAQVPGKGYRLLSEAEWEYAARAGTSSRYAWGDDAANSAQCAWANGADASAKAKAADASGWTVAACDDGHAYTAPAGRFKANAFGLHDMAGNAYEWVQDVWHYNYSGAPGDGSAWMSGGDQSRRVLRGGSWYAYSRDLRSASRFRWFTPGNRSGSTGFRIARTY